MGRLVILLDVAGLALLVAAAWLFSPILGLAVGGVSLFFASAIVERASR